MYYDISKNIIKWYIILLEKYRKLNNVLLIKKNVKFLINSPNNKSNRNKLLFFQQFYHFEKLLKKTTRWFFIFFSFNHA